MYGATYSKAIETEKHMKAYQVRNTQTGAIVWETNNLPAACRKVDRLGAGFELVFNYGVNA